jgi:putative endonuclease
MKPPAKQALQQKRRAYRDGHWAELAAAALLRLKGYRILHRRFKTPVGEIDIIARRRHMVAFVEVKRRATRLAALEAVTPRSRERISRAASWYIGKNPELANLDLRFDVMALAPGRLPAHIKNAWTL